MSLEATEAALYTDAWSGVSDYANASPGESLVPMFMDMVFGMHSRASGRGLTVLDAGCGSGKGGVELTKHGFAVDLCDLTDAGLTDEAKALRFSQVCLWRHLPSQLPSMFGGAYDYVYCCDVLEHIPTEFAMLVVQRLLDITRFGLFLNISTVHDEFGIYVGRPLHHTVQSYSWWKERLAALGTLVESRDLLMSGVYLVTR